MKEFNAKLLLFGEYGLMYGAKALAIPFSRFKGKLVFSENLSDQAIGESRLELERFVSFFEHERLNEQMNFPLNLSQIKKDLAAGLFLKSDIPLQYGVGSSGMLCAAVYHRYSGYQDSLGAQRAKKNLLGILKEDFSVMEAYFHGKSSGFDPLVSFVNRPVLLAGKEIHLPAQPLKTSGFNVFLIDTKIKSSTAPLVRLFMQKMEQADFSTAFKSRFLPANDLAIQAFLAGDKDELFHQVRALSSFQLNYLQEMIPEAFQKVWRDLRDQETIVKLLGSGGGGFLLAFAPEGVQMPSELECIQVF